MEVTPEEDIETTQLHSWEQFLVRVKEAQQLQAEIKGLFHDKAPDVLFRGQGSSQWRLKTTLERAKPKLTSVADYYEVVHRTKHQLEAYTGNKWNVPAQTQFQRTLARDADLATRLPALDFLVYLRHHGFPSPLLDWTRSPFVAVFFAFDVAPPDTENVAIYVLNRLVGQLEDGGTTSKVIYSLGPRVRTHRRHFLQQAEYTLALDRRASDWYFDRHEDVLLGTRGAHTIEKLLLPISLRSEVLRHLDQFNLNSYTLYGSDDALVQSVARREMGY